MDGYDGELWTLIKEYKENKGKITNICIQIKLLRTHVILTPQPLPYPKFVMMNIYPKRFPFGIINVF